LNIRCKVFTIQEKNNKPKTWPINLSKREEYVNENEKPVCKKPFSDPTKCPAATGMKNGSVDRKFCEVIFAQALNPRRLPKIRVDNGYLNILNLR